MIVLCFVFLFFLLFIHLFNYKLVHWVLNRVLQGPRAQTHIIFALCIIWREFFLLELLTTQTLRLLRKLVARSDDIWS